MGRRKTLEERAWAWWRKSRKPGVIDTWIAGYTARQREEAKERRPKPLTRAWFKRPIKEATRAR